MTDDTDFGVLYAELRLDSDCTSEQLKQAYRRRVGALHPDRTGHPEDIAQLQHLNRLYAAALDFQRAHGRLPGACRRVSTDGPVPHETLATGFTRARLHSEPSILAPAKGIRGNRRPLHYLVAGLLVLAAFLVMKDTTQDRVITIGMHQDRVRLIQGSPSQRGEIRWDYGPSWIEFRCHQVIDWYSSPLQPLRVKGRRAEAVTAAAATTTQPTGC